MVFFVNSIWSLGEYWIVRFRSRAKLLQLNCWKIFPFSHSTLSERSENAERKHMNHSYAPYTWTHTYAQRHAHTHEYTHTHTHERQNDVDDERRWRKKNCVCFFFFFFLYFTFDELLTQRASEREWVLCIRSVLYRAVWCIDRPISTHSAKSLRSIRLLSSFVHSVFSLASFIC